MKLFLAAILAAFLVGTAHAGTITVTIVTAGVPCNAGACTKTYTDTDANLAKLVPTFQSACNTKINGTCSALQVLAFWFDNVIQSAADSVTAFDKVALANSATVGYVPINPK